MDAVGQFHESLQPSRFGLSNSSISTQLSAPQMTPHNGNGYDVNELVTPGVVGARVFQAAKVGGD
jgi:hypothetical protein